MNKVHEVIFLNGVYSIPSSESYRNILLIEYSMPFSNSFRATSNK